MPKKRFIVVLTLIERDQLDAMVSKGKEAAYRIKPANILLVLTRMAQT